MKLGFESSSFIKVSDIHIPDIFYNRLTTGIEELDKMFGGGILPGCAFTITGMPGSGKSSACLQLFEALAKQGCNVGYASGEENKYQLAFTCKRLNVKELKIANETDVDVLAKITQEYDALVIDAYQTLTTKEKMPSTKKTEYIIENLIQSGKNNECSIFLVMHHTVDGKPKGGTEILHAVDVNIEIIYDKNAEDETERTFSFYKNRFGPTGQFSTNLTPNGFDFSTFKKAVRVKNKKSRRLDQQEQILAMKEPPHVTLERVTRELAISKQQAYNLLKELVESKKLLKFGKGAAAVWKCTLPVSYVQVYNR